MIALSGHGYVALVVMVALLAIFAWAVIHMIRNEKLRDETWSQLNPDNQGDEDDWQP